MKPTSVATSPLESLSDTDFNTLDERSQENAYQECNLFTLDKLKETMKPLYLSLLSFGVPYEALQSPNIKLSSPVEPTRENSSDIEAQEKDIKQKFKCNIRIYYCVFIVVVLWFQVIFSFRNLFTTGSFMDVLIALVVFGWKLLCACQQLIFFQANFTKSKGTSKYGKLVKELVLVKADDISDTKRQMKRIVIVTWVTFFTSVIAVLVGLILTDESGKSEVREVLLGKWDKESITFVTYTYLPVHVILTGVWLFSTANYVALCVLVAKRFDDVFQRTSSAISFKQNINFASLRREHVQLCHVVSALDDILSPSGLVSYALEIPMMCVSLDVCIITYDQSSAVKRVVYIFWIIINMTFLLTRSISGAVVNNKAYCLSEIIYDIDANDLDHKSELELMLLISNLNSNSIGLTVGGLTTITKGMILTVFGTVIGYFTILIQFKA